MPSQLTGSSLASRLSTWHGPQVLRSGNRMSRRTMGPFQVWYVSVKNTWIIINTIMYSCLAHLINHVFLFGPYLSYTWLIMITIVTRFYNYIILIIQYYHLLSLHLTFPIPKPFALQVRKLELELRELKSQLAWGGLALEPRCWRGDGGATIYVCNVCKVCKVCINRMYDVWIV